MNYLHVWCRYAFAELAPIDLTWFFANGFSSKKERTRRTKRRTTKHSRATWREPLRCRSSGRRRQGQTVIIPSKSTSPRRGRSPNDQVAKSSSSPRLVQNLAVAKYEPFYLCSSTNERDVGVVLKNVKNVVYLNSSPETIGEKKCLKVYNFPLAEDQTKSA